MWVEKVSAPSRNFVRSSSGPLLWPPVWCGLVENCLRVNYETQVRIHKVMVAPYPLKPEEDGLVRVANLV